MQRDAMMLLGVRLGVFDGEEVSAATSVSEPPVP